MDKLRRVLSGQEDEEQGLTSQVTAVMSDSSSQSFRSGVYHLSSLSGALHSADSVCAERCAQPWGFSHTVSFYSWSTIRLND
ncbi:Hypothetical predicted protein [Pelobates cultripes]|uniref:Uncharacterized protein n=1 Tax=Pelobates cultripes TaxID=61616 RepID=A0AAD1VR23_PELCU|nr:Hypothetical predicted protein [Pelobates cultripes]